MSLKSALTSGPAQSCLSLLPVMGAGIWLMATLGKPLKDEHARVTEFAHQQGCVLAFGSPSDRGAYAGKYRCPGLNADRIYVYEDLKNLAPLK